LRIISGKHRSRRISAPKDLPVRPTTDLAKESLFNILNNDYYFDEIKVLDLFAGIGSISLEFASRECQDITAVDNHSGCVRFIESTAASLEMDMAINVRKADAFDFIQNTRESYDIIFCDPPFSMDDIDQLPVQIMDRDLLNEDGILIVEHGPKTNLEELPFFTGMRKYGNIRFSMFKKTSA
jgi:16S rRNA (guanine(966)-N(2))-methyltransferase RsmD